MAVTTTAVNEEVKSLKGDAFDLAMGLTELRTEVKGAIALARWAGAILVASFLTSGFGLIIWGATLTADVRHLEKRIDKLETSIDARFDKVDARFEKMEAILSKILEQTRLAPSDKVDARFEKMEGALSKILEQTRPAPKP